MLSQSKVSSVCLGHIRFWKDQEVMISRPSHEQTRQTLKVERTEAEGGGGGVRCPHTEPSGAHPAGHRDSSWGPSPTAESTSHLPKGRKATARVKRAKPNTDTGRGQEASVGATTTMQHPGFAPPCRGSSGKAGGPSSPGSGSPAWAPLAWLGPGQRGSCPPSPASASSGHQGAWGQTCSPAREARQTLRPLASCPRGW